jgi:hypothetical protein
MTPRPACHLEMGMRTLDVYQQVGSQIWSLPICTLMTISILCTLPDSCGQSSSVTRVLFYRNLMTDSLQNPDACNKPHATEQS